MKSIIQQAACVCDLLPEWWACTARMVSAVGERTLDLLAGFIHDGGDADCRGKRAGQGLPGTGAMFLFLPQ